MTDDQMLAEYRALYADLLAKYHQLAIGPVATAASVTIEEPDLPPDVVLAAMQTISPVRDKTYDANWAHWEKNKAKAAAYPEDFAREIIEGVVYEVTSFVEPGATS